jgi:hypothetical protein
MWSPDFDSLRYIQAMIVTNIEMKQRSDNILVVIVMLCRLKIFEWVKSFDVLLWWCNNERLLESAIWNSPQNIDKIEENLTKVQETVDQKYFGTMNNILTIAADSDRISLPNLWMKNCQLITTVLSRSSVSTESRTAETRKQIWLSRLVWCSQKWSVRWNMNLFSKGSPLPSRMLAILIPIRHSIRYILSTWFRAWQPTNRGSLETSYENSSIVMNVTRVSDSVSGVKTVGADERAF